MAKDLSGPIVEGYTKAEVDKVQKLFDKYDLDMNCSLERSEFRQILVACGLRDVDAGKIFKACDINRSGAVEFKEFINWLFSEAPEIDATRDAEIQERMGKVHKHMERAVMTKGETMEDYFEILTEIVKEYRYSKKRKEAVPVDKLLPGKCDALDPEAKGDKEKTRDVSLKDIFKQMDLNNNGQLTQSEFVRGLQSFGHDGDSEKLAEIFKELDTKKKMSRIWDREYHSQKAKEDALTEKAERRGGAGPILVGASEIFELRDMKRWTEARRTFVKEAMRQEESDEKDKMEAWKALQTEYQEKLKQKIEQEEKIASKKFASVKGALKTEEEWAAFHKEKRTSERLVMQFDEEGQRQWGSGSYNQDEELTDYEKQKQHIEEMSKDEIDQDHTLLAKINKELTKLEKTISEKEPTINGRNVRWHKTETKHKDGFVDFKEFKKAYKSWSGEELESTVTEEGEDP